MWDAAHMLCRTGNIECLQQQCFEQIAKKQQAEMPFTKETLIKF